jgi:two-component system chemotaxis sensor kinase CheA
MNAHDIDPEEIQIFLEEMDELLAVLEEDLLKLEKETGNPALIAEIFRAAHTLKGSAGTIGFPALAQLAHAMESVFDGVRKGNMPVTARLIDVFLKCMDALGRARGEIQEQGTVASTFDPLLADLERIRDPQPPGDAPAEPPPPQEIAVAEKQTPAETPADPRCTHGVRSVRVNVERMDAIMDLVGELVIKRTRMSQLCNALDDGEGPLHEVAETADHIEHITAQLQEHILKARLLPLDNVFHKFPRMVRDLSQITGKQVDLEITGGDTELDRSVLEQIGDPLMHILRNCVDHGIEPPAERQSAGKNPQGRIRIGAGHVEDHVVVTVEDDGRGIDTNKALERARQLALAPPEFLDRMKESDILNLIFTPGFSTKDQAGEISGRGVGMDVVRTNIEKLNGSVVLQSSPGQGTKMIIKLPLTLAIISSLLVRVRGRIFAIPLISVSKTLRVDPADIKLVQGREAILFEDAALPLVRLDRVFGISDDRARHRPRLFIVVVSWGGQRAGLVVDSLAGDQDIVIRPLGEYVGDTPGISGAAILGDGGIALIIDVGGILKRRAEIELPG